MTTPSGPTGRLHQRIGQQLRHLGDGQEILKQERGDHDEEDRRRRAQRLDQAFDDLRPTAAAARDADHHRAEDAEARGLGDRDEAAEDAAHHEEEQQRASPTHP